MRQYNHVLSFLLEKIYKTKVNAFIAFRTGFDKKRLKMLKKGTSQSIF